MSVLEKVTFAFHAGLSQFFISTGTVEKPLEKFNVTPSVQEGIIASYLTKPGILTAPDGSQFLLELTLLPAFREARQRLIDQAQERITAANYLPMPEEGTPDAELLAQLTQADRDLLARIFKARKAGQRVTFRYPPFKAEVNFGTVPKKPKAKEPKIKEPAFERGDLQWSEDMRNASFVPNSEGRNFLTIQPPIPAPPVERVPVVVLTIPNEDSRNIIIERSKWDEWANASTSQESDWVEKSIHAFCSIYNILRTDIATVDFDQTRTREELDNIPGML